MSVKSQSKLKAFAKKDGEIIEAMKKLSKKQSSTLVSLINEDRLTHGKVVIA
jgi:hypothetical protein